MDGRLPRTNCDEAGPNVLSPRDLVSRPDNMDETVLSSSHVGPQGFWGSGKKGYLFSGSWGALLIILGELGSKHILLGI